MPKNAVERLKKLENDIKTVISIYEVAKKSTLENDDKNDDAENEVKSQSFLGTKLPNGDKPKWGLTEKCNSAFEHFKKLANFTPRIGNRFNFSPEKKTSEPKKPSSAPSSSSTATVCESDYLWQPTSESNNAKWTGLTNSYTVLMTPSKTLQAANEVLDKNNFQSEEVKQLTDYSVNQSTTAQNKEQDHVQNCQKTEVNSNCHVTREVSQRKITEKPNKALSHAKIEKEFSPTKSKFASNDVAPEIPQTVNVTPNTIPRLLKERLESFELKNREKSLPEKPKRSLEQNNHEKINCTERYAPGTRHDKEKDKWKAEEKKIKKTVNAPNGQKIQKEEGGKLNANQLFQMIARSNEKLEKMQTSKELALDIAAQLKEKHEEMRRSKEDMMMKLQKLEKDNERLSMEIKDAREKKRRLKLKMEGFCSYSKTKLLKQDLRNIEIMEENEWLKSKIQELEKKFNEDYIETLVQMDKTQKDRLAEIKNELKNRDTRAEEEIKKLIYEKSKLLEKIQDLHHCLQQRQSTVKTLEEKVGILEEEIERQQKNLMKKTERLEETHKELETIREKSQILEEQVKTLRTNIETFDQMQKTLMIGIADRESQIRTTQTEIENLQGENASLRKEIEKEKDAVLIKNKIIEDQQETIKQLREKSDEVKTLTKRNQSLERLLSREREEKLELQEALKCLKTKKEELKKKVKSLEADLLLAPEEVVRDLQKTQMVLHELENQVHLKQKEWEHHLQLLIKEKEQACSVAEFATKKLMQTTSKFQKQSEAHKKLHQVLAENLAEKERHLQETLSKVSKLIYSKH